MSIFHGEIFNKATNSWISNELYYDIADMNEIKGPLMIQKNKMLW